MSARPARTPVKVLFIAGWGRSGTTILDNIIGGHEGVFTAGELFHLWQWGFLEGRKCGCGEPLTDCALWGEVLRVAFGDDVPDPAEMVALQRSVAGVRHTPALLAGARTNRSDPRVARYASVLSRLYTAIAAVTGARVVVDASKRPPDAVLAGRTPGIEPYLLHMVRDPRAVAHSWQRRKAWTDTRAPAEMTRHGLLMNGAHWVGWNIGAEAARMAYPRGRYLRLRYEDLMSDPRGSVEQVFAHLGEPTPAGPFRDERTVVLPTNHTAAGNPSRFRTGEVRITPDDAWMTEQDPAARRGTTALSLPLLGRYRYPLWIRPAANGHRSTSRR